MSDCSSSQGEKIFFSTLSASVLSKFLSLMFFFLFLFLFNHCENKRAHLHHVYEAGKSRSVYEGR